MAYRIQRSMKGEAIVFALSGEMDDEHTERLKELLKIESRSRILLDLKHVTIVGRTAVQFLAQIEATGVRILNCPDYVRSWIVAENRGPQST